MMRLSYRSHLLFWILIFHLDHGLSGATLINGSLFRVATVAVIPGYTFWVKDYNVTWTVHLYEVSQRRKGSQEKKVYSDWVIPRLHGENNLNISFFSFCCSKYFFLFPCTDENPAVFRMRMSSAFPNLSFFILETYACFGSMGPTTVFFFLVFVF